eukprot:6646330-Prymnesium_polylepis.1
MALGGSDAKISAARRGATPRGRALRIRCRLPKSSPGAARAPRRGGGQWRRGVAAAPPACNAACCV